MPVVERYKVQLVGGPLADIERWTLDGCPLLMGGSIVSNADAKHLRYDFGVTHVLNLETEHTDQYGCFDAVCNNQTPDDGQMKPKEWFRTGIEFVRGAGTCYVHCQAGGSRTPMMVYALLRALYGCDPASALTLIQTVKPSFGSAPYHVNYIASAEQAL